VQTLGLQVRARVGFLSCGSCLHGSSPSRSAFEQAFTLVARACMDLHPPGPRLRRHLPYRSGLVQTFIPQLSACVDLVLLVHHIVTPESPGSAFLCPMNPPGRSPFDLSSPLVRPGGAPQPHRSWFPWTLVTSFLSCLDHEPPVSSRLESRPSDPATRGLSNPPVAPATMPLFLESLFGFLHYSRLPWNLLGVV